jgi:ABC-type nitrate/sulfonate/bicarbonate transport system substrate-binding protein
MAKRLAREDERKGQERKAAKRRKNLIAGGIVAVAVLAVLVVAYLAMSAGAPKRTGEGLVAKGEQAPAFSLARLGGSGSVSLADFKGKVVVVNFWNSQ